MVINSFDTKQFFSRPDALAVLVPASELFGFLKRSFELPAQWGALIRRSSGDRVVAALGGAIPADGAEDILFARSSPVEVEFVEEGIATRDQFQFRVEVRFRVSLLHEAGEIESFQKNVMGSYRVATAANLVRYLQPTVRAALAQFAATLDADTLLSAAASKEVETTLGKALEPHCFTAGISIARPIGMKLDSVGYRHVQQSRQEAARRRGEHEASQQVRETVQRAQADHVQHIEGMLRKLKELAAKSPETPLAELIRAFSEHERGQIYKALFENEVANGRTQWLVVAVGEELLFFDPRNPAAAQRRLMMSGAAGPVRSVRLVSVASGSPQLLLGAATGIYRMTLDRAVPEATYVVAGAPPVRGGFNSAVRVGERIWGCHSELGIHEWVAASSGSSRSRFGSLTAKAGTVRGISQFNGELFCAIDDGIMSWAAEDLDDAPTRFFMGSRSPITSFVPTMDGVFAGNSDGDVLHWQNLLDEDGPVYIHRGNRRPVESVWLNTVQGVSRLFFADTSSQVHAMVLGDTFSSRFEAGGQTLRRADVGPDIVVATNELRDRLFGWQIGRPDKPAFMIPVSAICGRSIQDTCLVVETV